MRHTTFRFMLLPNPEQDVALRKHIGAARFAFNQSLRLVLDALEAKKTQPGIHVPWSGFDLIHAFNAWKRSESAGVDEQGSLGLPWRNEICQQVFEEAAVGLGQALAAISASRKKRRRGKRPGFPKFKKKSSPRQSFRIRAKASTHGRSSIRVGESDARSVTLPKLGLMPVREDTRKLRRMLYAGRAKILFATVSWRAGRWTVSLNVEAAPLHPAHHHDSSQTRVPRGIDRALPKLKRQCRRLSRTQKGSHNRVRAQVRLGRLHQRIANVRRDFVQQVSSRLAKNHGLLVIEDLCTSGLMRTRLARSIGDSGWGQFASALSYKMAWRDGTLVLADRFYPSTRRCSACEHVGEALSLSERTFCFRGCGHQADRDVNAAANLAQWLEVAAKRVETLNACGERSAGERPRAVRETALDEAGRASARRPRRAVLAEKTVNAL